MLLMAQVSTNRRRVTVRQNTQELALPLLPRRHKKKPHLAVRLRSSLIITPAFLTGEP
jgi:hypothetical protein